MVARQDPASRFNCQNTPSRLKTLAEDGRDAMYRGELAERLHDFTCAAKVVLCEAEDLANHAGMWVDPISMTCGDVTFHQIPPNGQGIAMLFALGSCGIGCVGARPRWG